MNESTATLAAIESLQRLADVFSERRRQLAREVGLTEAQWRMLEEGESDAFLPSLCARRRAGTPAAVSHTLRQLLEAKLVQTRVGPEDGRRRIYGLTSRGRRTLARLRASRSRAIDAIWKPLGDGNLTTFTRCSNALAERLEVYAKENPGDASTPRR